MINLAKTQIKMKALYLKLKKRVKVCSTLSEKFSCFSSKFHIPDIQDRLSKISEHRERAVCCLEKQGRKMLKTSAKKMGLVTVGTTVRVPIPDVDRARGAPRNIIAIVTEAQDGVYKLGK